jgi:hypothetical protein
MPRRSKQADAIRQRSRRPSADLPQPGTSTSTASQRSSTAASSSSSSSATSAKPQAHAATPAKPVATKRSSSLSGNKLDVKFEENGQVVRQANVELNLPNVIATVFSTTHRDRGEVPFAIDKDGKIYTPSEEERQRVASFGARDAGRTVHARTDDRRHHEGSVGLRTQDGHCAARR